MHKYIYELFPNDSNIKHSRRIELCNTFIDSVNKLDTLSISFFDLSQTIHINKRSLYNYFNSIDELYACSYIIVYNNIKTVLDELFLVLDQKEITGLDYIKVAMKQILAINLYNKLKLSISFLYLYDAYITHSGINCLTLNYLDEVVKEMNIQNINFRTHLFIEENNGTLNIPVTQSIYDVEKLFEQLIVKYSIIFYTSKNSTEYMGFYTIFSNTVDQLVYSYRKNDALSINRK